MYQAQCSCESNRITSLLHTEKVPKLNMKQPQRKINGQFLPVCKNDMNKRNWSELDVLFISGDAYIDHPAFGVPLLARHLEQAGFRVGIIAQPDWKNIESLTAMGRPRLFAAISAGAMDSMVNHFTAAKKIRRNDAYTPGGEAGRRPNRAVIAYTAAVKGAFKGIPTIIGGIEASLRRFAHYDYWDDKVRRSILADSKADLLVYGMAETALLEIAQRLNRNEQISDLTDIRGTAFLSNVKPLTGQELPSFEQVSTDPDAYNNAFKEMSYHNHPETAQILYQAHSSKYLIVNPPSQPLTCDQMDNIYALPFCRQPHPMYTQKIPAYEQIRHSITSHRGCFGGCSFCAITHHQGKIIQSRSKQSILKEIDQLVRQSDFHGTISDIGGPTANMYGLGCGNPDVQKNCRRLSCLYPDVCKNLQTNDQEATELLKAARQHDKVKHVFVASGIRYDLLEKQPNYFDDLLQHHIGGLLKIAPESTVDKVTDIMRKPGAEVLTRFLKEFRHRSHELGLRQGIVPYLISGHPGCTIDDMIEVALYLKRHHLKVEQVQDFTPTPGSLSTCIYHTGKDPFSGKHIHIPRTTKEKRLQKALLLYHKPESRKDIIEALRLCAKDNLKTELLDSEKNLRKQKQASPPAASKPRRKPLKNVRKRR